MAIQFNPVDAVRYRRKCRAFIMGPSKSGKTLTSLYIARGLIGEEGKIFLIDTEADCADLYADEEVRFKKQNVPINAQIDDYMSLFKAAEKANFDAIILDSCTHFWDLFKDLASYEGKNKFTNNVWGGWATVTPLMKKIIREIVSLNTHIIFTCRVKTDYVVEPKENGKLGPKKIGLKPEFKGDVDYEFDLICTMDMEHNMSIESRYIKFSETYIEKPNKEFGKSIIAWLEEGKPNPNIPSKKGVTTQYGIYAIYLEGEEKYKKAISYLNKQGAFIIDDDYKIIESPRRLTELEEREGWEMTLVDETNIEYYKMNIKNLLLDSDHKNIPIADTIDDALKQLEVGAH